MNSLSFLEYCTKHNSLVYDAVNCKACPLRDGCDQVVVGSGPFDGKADIFIVGEHSDYEDDLMGEPFSGRTGLLLKKLLMSAGIAHEKCFLTLAVKCMPKKAADIKAAHVKTCSTWLYKEIELMKPRVVLSLGRIPTALLLNLKTKVALSTVVGTFQRIGFRDFAADVAPWYGVNHMLQRGKAADAEAIAFFKQVKQKVDIDALASKSLAAGATR